MGCRLFWRGGLRGEFGRVGLPDTTVLETERIERSGSCIFAFSVAEAKVQNRRRLRSYAAAAAVVAGSSLWLCALIKLGLSHQAIPWYVTLSLVAIFCGTHATQPLPALDLFELRKASSREPITLLEAWALSYLISAALMYGFTCNPARMQEARPRLVQFIDIKLVSEADFSNQSSPLPGTQEKTELHKRESDSTTAQGALNAVKVAKIAHRSAKNEEAPTQPTNVKPPQTTQAPKNTAAAQPAEHLALAHSKKAKQPDSPNVKQPPLVSSMDHQQQQRADVVPPFSVTPQHVQLKHNVNSSPSQSMFEETQPPELVEMVENDGARDSSNVFQAGGRTEGGTGQANDLSAYIKELHHKLRNAWAPPHGQSRQAKLLFRIRKDGQLSFLKVIASSGDNETDAAAIKAVQSAVKKRPLPDSYEFPYLDVQYTFRYGADEMKELKSAEKN